MARQEYAGTAINELLNDLPRLILQWQATAESSRIADEKLAAQEKLSLLDAVQKNALSRSEIDRRRADDARTEIDSIEDSITTAVGYMPTMPEFQTLEGQHLGHKIIEEFTGPYAEIAKSAIDTANEYSDLAANLEAEEDFLKGIQRNLTSLELQAGNVRADLAGADYLKQEDDFIEYFDTVLASKFKNDPMANYYKTAFTSMAPTFDEQRKKALEEYATVTTIKGKVDAEAQKVQTAFTPYATRVGALYKDDSLDFTEEFIKSDIYKGALDIIRSYNPGINNELAEERLNTILNTYGMQTDMAHIGMELIKGQPEAEDILSMIFPGDWYKIERAYQEYITARTIGFSAGQVPVTTTEDEDKVDEFDTFLQGID